jgi:hypothetical protein
MEPLVYMYSKLKLIQLRTFTDNVRMWPAAGPQAAAGRDDETDLEVARHKQPPGATTSPILFTRRDSRQAAAGRETTSLIDLVQKKRRRQPSRTWPSVDRLH